MLQYMDILIVHMQIFTPLTAIRNHERHPYKYLVLSLLILLVLPVYSRAELFMNIIKMCIFTKSSMSLNLGTDILLHCMCNVTSSLTLRLHENFFPQKNI